MSGTNRLDEKKEWFNHFSIRKIKDQTTSYQTCNNAEYHEESPYHIFHEFYTFSLYLRIAVKLQSTGQTGRSLLLGGEPDV